MSFADFSGVIAMCARELELIRQPRVATVQGRKRAIDEMPSQCITGSLQNPRDQELEELPELQRRDGVRSLYTTCKLKMGEVDDEYETDQILDPVTGILYEVAAERDWFAEGGYYRYILQKVGQ